MWRTRRSVMVGLTAAVLAVMGTPAAAGAADHRVVNGPLVDLRPGVSDPTDGARARVVVKETTRGTVVTLQVGGLDRSTAGESFGAHVHVGPCVPGDGAAAGPHYNANPPQVDETTEVWLDFTVDRRGKAATVARVPFVIPDGAAQSVVVHEHPTDPSGAAGARLACIGVAF